MVALAGEQSGNLPVIKSAAILAVALAALPCHAQTVRDSMRSVGGGGRSAYIPSDAAMANMEAERKERARLAAIPKDMTPKMIWLEKGKILQRQKDADGTTLLWLTYIKRLPDSIEEGTYVVAGHPDAENLAVNENAPCIVVPGPVRDDLGGERLYYFFDKREVTPETLARFQSRHPSVPLE